MPTPTPAPSTTPRYARHRPEETLLYRVVRDHLDPFLAMARERSSRPLPDYVEREFRAYLACGLLEHGFARCHCDRCGRDMFVAFSCKGRGVCPSCATRRMCDIAARIHDRVIPAIPVRQWVLSLPYALRLVCARRVDVLTAVDRVFADEVARFYRSHAEGVDARRVATGAVTFVQRFGSLNLNVHLHVACADGVFVRDDSSRVVTFHATPAPHPDAIRAVATRVGTRIQRLLRRRKVFADVRPVEEASNDTVATDALGSCEHFALQRGTLANVTDRGAVVGLEEARDERRFGRAKPDRWAAAVDGFDVHAGVRVGSEDGDGRERLVRYCARPPIALSRMTLLPDGRIAYRLKHTRSGGPTHRVVTPVEFLARVAAMIPPPKYPLVRYHGVFAPNSTWRRDVVPQTPPGHGSVCEGQTGSAPSAPKGSMARRRSGDRIDWRTLLRRTHGVDALECPCGSWLRAIAVVTERAAIERILAHIGEVTVSRVGGQVVVVPHEQGLPPPDE